MRSCNIRRLVSVMTPLQISTTRRETRRIFSSFPGLKQNVQPAQETKLKRFEDIPGPLKLPYLKSAWVFLPIIGQYDVSTLETSYKRLYAKYGKMVRIEIKGEQPTILLFDRDLIRKVYEEEGSSPHRPGLKYLLKYRESRLDTYPSLGLFLLQGEEWKKLRNLGQKPLLRIPSVRLYLNSMENVSKDFIERLRKLRDEKMEVQNIMQELFRWALESVGVFALHKRLGCLDENLPKDSEPRRLINAVNETFRALHDLEIAINWKTFFPKKTYEELVKAQDYFTEVTYKYLKEALDEIQTRGPRKQGDEIYLLDAFLTESKMDLNQVAGIVLDLFFAGIDTTSSAVAFTLYYIASHQDRQQKLHKEISRLLPTKDSPVTAEVLDNVPFLRAFVKESLRLHPITVGSARVLDHDTVLDGYHIPKGTVIGLMLSLTSRLEKYYELPDEFLPERWLEGNTEEEKLQRQSVGLKGTYSSQPFASLPFSHGLRMCIGRRFAEQELYVILIKILQNFTLEYHHEPIKSSQRLINIPDKPLNIVFREKE